MSEDDDWDPVGDDADDAPEDEAPADDAGFDDADEPGTDDDAAAPEDVGADDPADSPAEGAGDGPAAGAGGNPAKGPDEKFCVECGEVIRQKAEICPECGVRQPDVGGGGSASAGGSTGSATSTSSDKDRVAAALLAILLGGLGAHKFYLGDVGMGILYLCFSWTFIPAIVGLIEGIIYLTKSDEEFQRQYGA